MLNPIERENEILGILEKFSEADLKYIIVGGYAVSAYRHRFSVDADIVIKREDVDKFAEILHKNGFRKTISRNLENAYSSEFARYEKFWPKVSVDLDMDFIRKNLFRGNKAVVKDNMKQLSLLIEKSEFQDSFKGVFMEKNYRL